MIKISKLIIITFLIISEGCKPLGQNNTIMNIRWTKITNTNKDVSFIQVDSTQKGYLISYSYSNSISGGFKIIEAQMKDEKIKTNILFEEPINTIHRVKTLDSTIGLVSINFKNNTMNSSLMLSFDFGSHWNIIQTPLQIVRSFDLLPNTTFIEGTINNGRYIYSSRDKINWEEVHVNKLGYKNIMMLNKEINGKIFCLINKTYTYKGNKLALINSNTNLITELFKVRNENSFIIPISKDSNLFSVVEGRKIIIYSYDGKFVTLKNKFKTPKETEVVRNLYIDNDILLISCETQDFNKKILTWISYNKGKDWISIEHANELKLVFNSLGEIWAINNKNDILKGFFNIE